MSRPRLVIALLVSVSLVAGCSSSSTGADAPEPPTPVSAAATMTGPTTAAQPTPAAPAATAAPAPTMALVGDIASCSTDTDEQVAALIGPDVSVIGLLGDTVYDHGSPGEFARCFEPAWAPLLPRVRPAPGNHDYGTHDAAGYFAFFGAAAGEPGRGWYSYDVGTWHVVALNSNCSAVGGCDVGVAARPVVAR